MRLMRENGDTMIEVLVSLAVLGFILTLAYTMSSRNLQTIRQAHERTEATKVAEGQIELIKAAAKNNSNSIFVARTQPYCVEGNLNVVNFSPPPTHIAPTSTNLDTDEFIYPDQCKNHGVSELYHVSVAPPPTAQGGLFTVRVRWERFGGATNDEVKFEYKTYKDTK